MKRKWLTTLFAVAAGIGAFFLQDNISVLQMSEVQAAEAVSGECGTDGSNLTWELDENGVLTISGSGKMADYTNYTDTAAPWERSGITSVVIKEGVTSVGNYAFYYCRNIESVELPDSLTSIGEYAFSGGDYLWSDDQFKLTEITIPERVSRIDNHAFFNLTSLSSINVPADVNYIGAQAFHNTAWYTALKEEANGEPIIISSILIDASDVKGDFTISSDIKGIAGYAASKNEELTGVTIPDSVSYIGDNAFEYCSAIKEIAIGDGVTEIGDRAFCGCNSMTEIMIPRNVCTIGELAFCAKALESINVSGSNEYFTAPDGVLYNKQMKELICYPTAKAGESYTIPDSVKYIAPYAVYDISQLKNITVPEGITELGEYAFAYSGKLQSITIPDSVTTVGKSAFYGCSALKEAYIGNGLKSLSNDMFGNCTAMTSVRLSEGLNTLETYAFSWCRSLESITIPDSVESIGSKAFWCCLSLKDVHIGSGLKEIGSEAFYQCGKIENINIPDGVTSIGEKAFFECSSITEIVIPASVTNLGNLPYGTSYSTGVFDGCTGLEKATLLCEISSLSNYLFYNCTNLKYISMPETVSRIGEYAFSGCISLESISLPASVTVIGESAFSGCKSLSEISLPYGLYIIYKKAFYNCYGLKNINIPASVRMIGDEAFYGCVNLTSVFIPENVQNIGKNAFMTYGTEAEYTYELYALSDVGSVLYDGTSARIYIRTNNPDPDSFYISTSMPYSSSNSTYDDIEYTNAGDSHTFKAVEGGYIWVFTPSVSGTYEFMVVEKDTLSDKHTIASQFELTINDYDTAYNAWMDEVIESQTNDSMTNFEKMSAVSSYLGSTFKYLTNNNGKLVSLAAVPNGPCFAAHRWDSYISPAALCQFAIRIGGFDKIDNLYSHYAQYGFSWSSGHYLCYCEANGEGKFYEACPVTPTGYVDVKMIDFSDPAQLFSLADMKTKTITYQPVTIQGKSGSAAETFALENGISFETIITVSGDINADGKFDIADIVLLQKWISDVPGTNVPDWEAGDICENGKLDVFDLCLMKRLLLNS